MKIPLYQPLRLEQILESLPDLVSSWRGDRAAEAKFVCAPEAPQTDGLSFAHSARALKNLSPSPVAILVLPAAAEKEDREWPAQGVIFARNPEWFMAEVFHRFARPTPFRASSWEGIHPTAQVHPSAELAADVQVGPYAVIGARCVLKDGCFIGAHTVVEEDVKVGQNTTLHPHVYVGHSCEIGDDVEVQSHTTIGCEGFGYAHNQKGEHRRIPHLGKVIVESQVDIGANCAIDRGTLGDTIIRTGTKMDNHCHIAHNCEIGRHGLVTAKFVMAGSGKVGDHFVCGGRATIGGHVRVVDKVTLAALSVISKDLEKPGEYGGYPLQPLREYMKTRASSVHIPEMRRQIGELKQAIEKLEKASEK